METGIEQERTLKDLSPNAAGLLCYVAGWVSGIVFLVLEQKNRFVRFHALQSIIVFGALTLAGSVLGHIPFAGPAFTGMIVVLGFVLWLVLMIKANAGEMVKMPWAGNLAEKLTVDSMGSFTQNTPANGPGAGAAAPLPSVQVAQSSSKGVNSTAREAFRARYYTFGARTGRIIGSSLAIIISLALIVFFNFYYQYIAYYQPMETDGGSYWYMQTLITQDIHNWLPLLNATLIFSIIGHAFLIAFDRYLLRQGVHIFLDIMGLATVVSLLTIFPFDFSVLPNSDAAWGAQIGTAITLLLIAVGFGIGVLTRSIRLIINVTSGRY
jgi:uncharacterized membrane protein